MCLRKLQRLLQATSQLKAFDRIMQHIHPVSCTDESLVVEMPVTEDVVNAYGSLHGGASATIVDCVSSLDLIRRRGNSGVSLELSLSYMTPASIGDTVILESKLLKLGKSIAFCQVDIRHKDTQKLVAVGKHCKYLKS